MPKKAVAAFDFSYGVHFFDKSENDLSKFAVFKKGAELPEELVKRLAQHNPEHVSFEDKKDEKEKVNKDEDPLKPVKRGKN